MLTNKIIYIQIYIYILVNLIIILKQYTTSLDNLLTLKSVSTIKQAKFEIGRHSNTRAT